MSLEITVDENPQLRQACELPAGTFVHRRSDSDTYPTVLLLTSNDSLDRDGRNYFITDMKSGYTSPCTPEAKFVPYSGATLRVMR